MKTSIITANIVSCLFLIIVLFGQSSRSIKHTKSNKSYIAAVISGIAALIIDSASYILEGPVANTGILTLINALSYIARDALFLSFGFYLFALVSEKKKISNVFKYILIAMETFDVLGVTFTTAAGTLFTIENGVYVEGPLSPVSVASQGIVFIYLFIIMIKHKNDLGTRNIIALVTYMILPVIDIVLEILIEGFCFPYVACAASLAILYVVVQTRRLNEGALREMILYEISSIDALTGLKNRRSYEENLAILRGSESLGVIFCDINGLKQTNDTLGHKFGDELIKKFSSLLTKHFHDYLTFRISGDEFVVLLPDEDSLVFNSLCENFRKELNSNNQIASCGASFGTKNEVSNLIKLAEKNMYEDKRAYYSRIGYNRRSF